MAIQEEDIIQEDMDTVEEVLEETITGDKVPTEADEILEAV